jgi:nitroreductase
MLDPDTITAAVALACRAPSLLNSQPWRWVAEGRVIELFADRSRIGHATDTSGREVILSCGAALDHLRVAMAARGWNSMVDRFPNPNDPDHLATVDFSAMEYVTDAHQQRAEAILRRHTDRLPMAAPADWESFDTLLRSTFSADDAILTVLPPQARPKLAEASRLTEGLRRYDSSYHAELSWWTSGLEPDEGVPLSSVPTPDENRLVGVDREFSLGGKDERRPGIGADHATILVLSTWDDTSGDVLKCGEVLSTVLLECTMAGLATCPLSHMIELAASRDIVAELIGRAGLPQLLIRVGQAAEGQAAPPPTPRRPVAEVLEFLS